MKRLYHGTSKEAAKNIEKKGIDLSYSRNYTDFGKGFYLTDKKGKAKEWATKELLSKGSVVIFDAELEGLSGKEFDGFEEEWKETLYNERVLHNDTLPYDYVVGPIADGKSIKRLVNKARGGNMSKEEFIKQIVEREIGTQYAFKTDKAISHLTFVDKEDV